MAATAMLCRRSLGARVVPLAVGFTLSSLVLTRQQAPLRMDAYYEPRPASRPPPSISRDELDDDFINPDVLKQLSGGSMAGFISGVLVSVFSRTLVLLIGVTIVTVQVAARYGIDLIQQLNVKDRVRSSRILSALRDKTPFKLSFGLTFALSAFMHF